MSTPWPKWSDTIPEDSDFQNVYPAFYRSQALILQEILGTLSANSTVGTRFWQIGKNLWITQNIAAFNTWPNITQDDTTVSSFAVAYSIDPTSGAAYSIWYCAAGSTSLVSLFSIASNGTVTLGPITPISSPLVVNGQVSASQFNGILNGALVAGVAQTINALTTGVIQDNGNLTVNQAASIGATLDVYGQLNAHSSLYLAGNPVVSRNVVSYNGGSLVESTGASTFNSTGYGCGGIAPRVAGALKINASFYGQGSNGSNMTFQIYRSTAGVPGTATIIPGGDVSVWATPTLPGNGNYMSLSADFVDIGLSIGQTYFYYIGYNNGTGGTTSCTRASIYAEE